MIRWCGFLGQHPIIYKVIEVQKKNSPEFGDTEARLAQPAEHVTVNHGVSGSNPLLSDVHFFAWILPFLAVRRALKLYCFII